MTGADIGAAGGAAITAIAGGIICGNKDENKSGEGPFEGIQGSSDMSIRSALGAMAVDAKSGSVIQAAEGLAIWPNLKYTLPSK